MPLYFWNWPSFQIKMRTHKREWYSLLWNKRQGELPNWKTQNGSSWTFAFPGRSSTGQPVAKFNKKCPNTEGVQNSPKKNLGRTGILQHRWVYGTWLGERGTHHLTIGLEWNNSNAWERVNEQSCMFERDFDVRLHVIWLCVCDQIQQFLSMWSTYNSSEKSFLIFSLLFGVLRKKRRQFSRHFFEETTG